MSGIPASGDIHFSGMSGVASHSSPIIIFPITVTPRGYPRERGHIVGKVNPPRTRNNLMNRTDGVTVSSSLLSPNRRDVAVPGHLFATCLHRSFCSRVSSRCVAFHKPELNPATRSRIPFRRNSLNLFYLVAFISFLLRFFFFIRCYTKSLLSFSLSSPVPSHFETIPTENPIYICTCMHTYITLNFLHMFSFAGT